MPPKNNKKGPVVQKAYAVYDAADDELKSGLFKTEDDAIEDARDLLQQSSDEGVDPKDYQLYIVQVTAVGRINIEKSAVEVSLDRSDRDMRV